MNKKERKNKKRNNKTDKATYLITINAYRFYFNKHNRNYPPKFRKRQYFKLMVQQMSDRAIHSLDTYLNSFYPTVTLEEIL